MHATGLQAAGPLPRRRTQKLHRSSRRRQRSRGLRSTAITQAVLTSIPLAAADLVSVLASLAVARGLTQTAAAAADVEWFALAAGLSLAVLLASAAVGLYPGIGLSAVAEARGSAIAAALICPIFLAVALAESALGAQLAIVITCLLLLLSLPAARAGARALCGRFAWWGQSALVVGDAGSAAAMYSFLRRNPRFGLRPLGIVSNWTHRRAMPPYLLGPLAQMPELVDELDARWLIVAMPRRGDHEVRTVVARIPWELGRKTLVFRAASPNLWKRAGRCGEWLTGRDRCGQSQLGLAVKRLIDLTLLTVLGLALLPLLLSIAALVKASSPGPVLFRQRRVGFGGKEFVVWKFRTMVLDGEPVLRAYLAAHHEEREAWERDHKLERDPRVTCVGRWLRKFSLDELPQLVNVLRGEMSLVGPRPILPSEIPDFGDSFPAFCSVMPGITGLWQVCGRNGTTYAEHVELDDFYARNWSLWLDFYILALTAKVVVLRDGAY